MANLFNSIESLGLKIGSLAAGLIIANKTGVRDIILANSGGGDVEEVVRYGAYLSAVEWVSDMAITQVLGARSINFHLDSGYGFLITFSTNVGIYYIMEKTDILDTLLESLGDDEMARAFANASVYALTQEITYYLLQMWMKPTSGDYGQKFQF